jgi:hypothetical protein
MADVPAIAVTVQKNQLPVSDIGCRRKKPAVELNRIAGFEKNIFERPAQFRRGRLQLAHRVVNATVFKPTE